MRFVNDDGLVDFAQPNYPSAGLVVDAAGNLYGATPNGGVFSKGQVFEISPTAGGGWTHKTIYGLLGGFADGQTPYGGVVLDSAGSLYGTAYYGGTYNGGIVFELSPNGSGGWAEMILHQFTDGADGGNLIEEAEKEPYFHLYVPGWLAEKEPARRERLSPQYRKAWDASFPPALWPAVPKEEREDGKIYFRLKDGTKLFVGE